MKLCLPAGPTVDSHGARQYKIRQSSSIPIMTNKIGVTYLHLRSDMEESKVSGHEMVSNASSFILLNGVR